MTYKTTIKPSEVYPQGKEAVAKVLEGYNIISFRLPVYYLDAYLSADYLTIDGPFPSSNESDIGTSPRFIVTRKPTTEFFPEWE